MNQVTAIGMPKYFKKAPSIMDSGGTWANTMTNIKDKTNQAIWLKVTGKGS
ncbi:hypothetical protein GVanDAA620_28440 [Enterococcus faecium]|nr:hypothetical protein GVanDAA620_28440 [Enterococcus faecium]BDP68244.1 hypothetical protein EfmAA55_26730 [Enterococcus faecium]BDP93108.1 hypothetical protein EfmGK941_01130 [Enterococcus faecium]